MKNLSDNKLFKKFLEFVKNKTGFDLSKYRESFIKRRIVGRMIYLGFDDFVRYFDYITSTPEEVKILVNRIGIAVSKFFRDYEVFEKVEAIFKQDGRKKWFLWSAGCGAGEEVYSLSIILTQLNKPHTIIASDINQMSLKKALEARYDVFSVEFIPPKYENYFEKAGKFWIVKRERLIGNFFSLNIIF